MGFKDKKVNKSEFVTKTQFLNKCKNLLLNIKAFKVQEQSGG